MPTQTNASFGKIDAAPEGPGASPDVSAPGLQVRFWGVRGSIPTPGRTTLEYGGNTSCLEVRAGNQIIILDAGTGLRVLGRQLMEEFGERPLDLTLLLTHTHWDHIQGLPFFPPVYQYQNRLRILGYEGARHGLEAVLSSQMESPFFPIGLREVPANVKIEELKQMQFNLGDVQVEAFRAYHPGMCVGYRLSAGGSSVAFFPDNELRCEGTKSSADTAFAREHLMRMDNGRLSGFLHGTDVLIMDTQYDRQEYEYHVGWGHGCLEEVVALAMRSEVKQLFLFHHDPDHDDAKITAMVARGRSLVAEQKGTLKVDAAREGAVVQILNR
jgi:phosphoribosyl 1,2-cyclic phosphodiesterase